jgi:uncharacterized protein YuzE
MEKKNWDYDKEYDIYYCNFGGKVEHSMEILNGKVLLDFNKKGEVVGVQIMDFGKELKLSQKRFDKILKKGDKK